MVNRREFVRSSFDPERAVSVGQNRGFSVEMQRRFALVCEHERTVHRLVQRSVGDVPVFKRYPAGGETVFELDSVPC